MPALAIREGSLYSYRLHCQGPNGQEVSCKTATTGTGLNPYLELDEAVSRHEPFAGRDIYLLRSHKNEISSWPRDPKVLQADPDWQEVSQRTHKSQEVFWRLAGDVGRCFGAADCGALPEIARESLEALDDGHRWLWIVFDLAWQKVKGSPLQANRFIWREIEGEGGYFFPLEYDFAREWKHESKPGTGPDEAKRIEKLSFLKAWAERRPGFYCSSLDDLFSASVWAIDLLALHKAGSVTMTSHTWKRLILVGFLLILFLLGASIAACIWGSGENSFQRIINSSWLLGLVFVGWGCLASFIMGRETWRRIKKLLGLP